MEETPDRGWSAVENITVMLDEYNWPQTPSIAIDADGVAHAYWYQEFADGMLEPTGEETYYKTRTGGSWSDESYLLAGHVGRYTALALESNGHPAFVWAEDLVAGNRDVFLARDRDPAQVPSNAIDAHPRLAVYPLPCRGIASVRFVLDHPGLVQLDVYDVTGRLVIRLADGIRVAGSHTLSWNGRDARGIKLPSAVYHARLTTGGQSATGTILLLE